MLTLERVLNDLGDALLVIDSSGIPFKTFRPGVGPYGEPQLMKKVVEHLRKSAPYHSAQTRRTPDILIPEEWALEIKLVRPYGDNGKEAENWSVNLMHPYEGNVSAIGDCLKLARLPCHERKAVVVIGYEHTHGRSVSHLSSTRSNLFFEGSDENPFGVENANNESWALPSDSPAIHCYRMGSTLSMHLHVNLLPLHEWHCAILISLSMNS
jgi:hypothetical protein